MSFNSYGKMNSDEVGIYLQLKTDAIITAVPLLYIAPPPSRHDTQQIPVVRSLGLYCRETQPPCLRWWYPLKWTSLSLSSVIA